LQEIYQFLEGKTMDITCVKNTGITLSIK